MSKKVLCFLLFYFLLFQSQAQQLSGQHVMSTFKDFIPPKGPLTGREFKMNEMREAMKNGKKTAWIVYADRDDVKTFKTPEKKDPLKKINFMDAFFVVSTVDNGRMLQIVSYNADIFNFDEQRLNDSYKESRDYFGWVDADKMLLWENALIDPSTRSTVKALTTVTPEMFGDLQHYLQEFSIKVFKSPDIDNRSENTVRPCTFYFLYKESENRCLIGQKDYITPADVKRKVLGWVPKQALELWSQRLFLEINTENDDVIAERKTANVFPTVFASSEEAYNFKMKMPIDSEQVLIQYPNEEKWNGFHARLPLLDTDTGGIVRTTLITDLNGDNFDLDMFRNEMKGRKKERVNPSNVIFVLCGNDNVRNSYSKISSAIRVATEAFGGSAGGNTEEGAPFNAGVVIFNSESNQRCQVNPPPLGLTSDIDKVARYIQNIVQSPNDCNSQGRSDEPYALYQAIQSANELLKGHENENNLLVIIGDAGSSTTEVGQLEDKVIGGNKINNDNLLVIQMNNPGTEYFDNFYRQTKRIAEMSAARVNSSNDKFKTLSPVLERKNTSDQGMFGWEMYEFSPATSSISGRFLFASNDASITSDLIKDNLVYSIKRYDRNKKPDQGKKEDKENELAIVLNPAMKKIIKGSGYDITDQKFLKQVSRYPFALNGYVNTNVNGLENDLYKTNILVSESEYMNIIELLKELGAGDLKTDARKVLTDVFRQSAEDYFSYNPADVNSINKVLDDIFFIVDGVHCKNEIFKKVRVNDIINNKKLSDADLKVMLYVFKTKKDKLTALLTNKNYRFEMDGNVFYWLPEEVLP